MYGAIIGDLAGSIYEYGQIKKVTAIKNLTELIPENAFFSDDTILTIAILEAILNDNNYEKYLKLYGKKYLEYKPNFTPYFKTTFSPGFTKWLTNDYQGTSAGNGAMMRISPIGYLSETETELTKNIEKATIPSHNSEEALYCAGIIAQIIYLARQGFTKRDIKTTLKLSPNYQPFQKFNTTCSATLDNCLYALFSSTSFEESLLKVISYGGDTDTNACIVGSMAEALYGLDPSLIKQAQTKIPEEFITVLDKGYQRINKNKSYLDI